MQKFEFLRQPLLGELAMSRKKERGEREEEREKNAIYSGHLGLCQQPRAAHALRSDQFQIFRPLMRNIPLVAFVDIMCDYMQKEDIIEDENSWWLGGEKRLE